MHVHINDLYEISASLCPIYKIVNGKSDSGPTTQEDSKYPTYHMVRPKHGLHKDHVIK